MALGNEQNGIFTKFKVFKSLGGDEKVTSLDAPEVPTTDFMANLLAAGGKPLPEVTGELINDLPDKANPAISNSLEQQTANGENSDTELTGDFATNGVTIGKVSDLDVGGELRPPENGEDDLMATLDEEEGNYNNCLRMAINAPNTDIDGGDKWVRYSNTSDEIVEKPKNSNQTNGAFLKGVIGGLVIISSAIITAKVMDLLFGTLSKGKNKKQLLDQAKLYKATEKLLNDEESLEITDDELRKLEEEVELRAQGKMQLDVGCAILDVELSVDDLTTVVNVVKDSNDPATIGKAIEDAFFNSFESDNKEKDKDAMKDGFFKLLIGGIVMLLVASATSTPQVRGLFALTASFGTTFPLLNNPIDDLNNNRSRSDCLAKDSRATMWELLFDMIKTMILAIVIPVIIVLLAEKIKQFITILKGLLKKKE